MTTLLCIGAIIIMGIIFVLAIMFPDQTAGVIGNITIAGCQFSCLAVGVVAVLVGMGLIYIIYVALEAAD